MGSPGDDRSRPCLHLLHAHRLARGPTARRSLASGCAAARRHPHALPQRGGGHRRQRPAAHLHPRPRPAHHGHRRRLRRRHRPGGRPGRRRARRGGSPSSSPCPPGKGGGPQRRAVDRALPVYHGVLLASRRRSHGRRRQARPPRHRGGAQGLRPAGGRCCPDGGAHQQPLRLPARPHAGHGVRHLHRGLPARPAPGPQRRHGRQRPVRPPQCTRRPGAPALDPVADRGLRLRDPAQRHQLDQRVLARGLRSPAGRDQHAPPPASAHPLVPGKPPGAAPAALRGPRAARPGAGRHALADPHALPAPDRLPADPVLPHHHGDRRGGRGPEVGAVMGVARGGLCHRLRAGAHLRLDLLAHRAQ